MNRPISKLVGVGAGLVLTLVSGCGDPNAATAPGDAVLEVVDRDVSVFSGGTFGLVVQGGGKNEPSSVSIDATGRRTEVPTPPWYGQWVVGSVEIPGGGIAVTTLKCDGERSHEDTSCSVDYLSTVWATTDAGRWDKVGSGLLPGTANREALYALPVAVSDDAATAYQVVDLYDHAILVEQHDEEVKVTTLPTSVTDVCAVSSGTVVQQHLDQSDVESMSGETATTYQPGGEQPLDTPKGPIQLVSFDGEPGPRIETNGRSLMCGRQGQLGLVDRTSRAVTMIDGADGSLGEPIEGPPDATPTAINRDGKSVIYRTRDERVHVCDGGGCKEAFDAEESTGWDVSEVALIDGALLVTTSRVEFPKATGESTESTEDPTWSFRVHIVPS